MTKKTITEDELEAALVEDGEDWKDIPITYWTLDGDERTYRDLEDEFIEEPDPSSPVADTMQDVRGLVAKWQAEEREKAISKATAELTKRKSNVVEFEPKRRSKTPAEPAQGIYRCHADAGTIDAWIEAADALGFEFRYNTFSNQKVLRIHPRYKDDTERAGRYMASDNEAVAAVNRIIERDAVAPRRNPATNETMAWVPVRLNRHDNLTARLSLFERDRFDPVIDYITDTIANITPSGESLIGKSIERGGLEVDAGPFTEAVQAYPWVFFVRNTLYPGAERREFVILHGERNCGKSAFVKNILPGHLRAYQHSGFDLTKTTKEQIESLRGYAIVEGAEVNRGAKGGIDWNAWKAFTSDTKPVARLAYREDAEQHLSRTTLVFTTNEPVLPPTDKAAASRFVWANITGSADLVFDSKSDTKGRAWAYLDSLFDPERPEFGTWREQFILEAYAIVKAAERVEMTPEGDSVATCDNPAWLPPDYKRKLDEWNARNGGAVVTDFSELADEIIAAIEMIRAEYLTLSLNRDEACFFATTDIQAAIYWNRQGKPFRSIFELTEEDRQHLDGATLHQVKQAIERTASPKRIGNARSEIAERLGEPVERVERRSPFAERGIPKCRGWAIGIPF